MDNIADIYELAPLQEGMLFHALYTPGVEVYFEQLHCRIRGPLDTASFRRAWQRLVERHSVLRTAFIWEDIAKPLQVVLSEVELPWRAEDWRSLPTDELAPAIEEFLRADRERGFQPAEAPLTRCSLVQLPEDEYLFVWSFHHIILDGWSLPILFKEVFLLYQSLTRGQEPYLPPPRPYRLYIEWLQGRDVGAAQEYWRRQMRPQPEPISLPIDSGREGGDRERETADEYHLTLHQDLSTRLTELARRTRVTLNTLVQAAWALLLSRYTGRRDVIYGVTVSGRPPELAGVDSIVGLLINTVPARFTVDPAQKLLPWLQSLLAAHNEREQYSYLPLVDIRQLSGLPADRSLFDSLLVFENYPLRPPDREDNDVAIEIGEVHGFERTSYPLTVLALPGERLSFRFVYDSWRYDAASIAQLAGHFTTILRGMIERPEGLLADLPLVDAEERSRILQNMKRSAHSATPRQDGSDGALVHRLFESQVGKTPAREALLDGVNSYSYSDLNVRANQVARLLTAKGIVAGSLVALCMERSAAALAAILGILKAGCAYLPLDPVYPRERLRFMLQDSQAAALLGDHTAAPLTGDVGLAIIDPGAEHDSFSAAAENLPRAGHPTDSAYLMYTSGSTGRPKGVVLSHAALVNLINWQVSGTGFTPGLRTLQFAALSFDVSFQEIFSTLCSGGTLVLYPEADRRDPEALWHFLCDASIGSVFLPYQALQNLALSADGVTRLPAALQQVYTAGEQLVITPQIRALFRRLPQTVLHNHYGPTETHVCSEFVLEGGAATWPELPPIGRAIANGLLYVLDESLQLQPAGIPGELYIGGQGLASAYHGQPALTAERFVPDPFSDERAARMYRSGDLALHRPDGSIEFLGRADQQLKIRGFRIEPAEVEAAILEHPTVREAICQTQSTPSGAQELLAYLVPDKTKSTPSEEDIRSFLSARLPEFMLPARCIFLDALPLTPSGKVDRRALAEAGTRVQVKMGHSARPLSPTEDIIAGIWAEVLGRSTVGAHDNFFTLGGHSLLATQIVSRLRTAFDCELPLRHIFSSPTVAALASIIDRERAGAGETVSATIVPAARDTVVPLSFAQQRLWFLDQLEGANGNYNIPSAIRLRGELDCEALQQALTDLCRRHESLCTRFVAHGGEARQIIDPPREMRLEQRDLRALGAEEGEVTLQRILDTEAWRAFDLQTGPLLRATLIRLADADYALLFTMHHIIADGWSMSVLVREFTLFYQAAVKGEPASLPPLKVQYADFAVWQRRSLKEGALKAQLHYWRAQLQNAPAELKLPTDRPRPAVQSFAGATRRVAIDAATTRELEALSADRGVSLFMTLLTAWATLLARYSDQRDIVIGAPIANRNRAEVETLIGFFVNTLVLRIALEDALSFEDLLPRVRRTALDAYAHQDLPFELLVEEMQPERSLSRAPLFQVMFVLQNTPAADLSLPGVAIKGLAVDNPVAKFDLTLFLYPGDDGLRGGLEYNRDLFDAATIDRMIGQYRELLQSVLQEPARPIRDLAVLTRKEHHLLTQDWAAAKTRPHSDTILHEMISRQAGLQPDATALIYEEEQLSYRQLDLESDRLAASLQGRGVEVEDCIGVALERSPRLVIALLAVLKAGAAYVPLDPEYPRERLAFMGRDAGLKLVICDERTALAWEQEDVALFNFTKAEDRFNATASRRRSTVGPDNLAYVIYTSGSTGMPKGVAMTHRAVLNTLSWRAAFYGIGPDCIQANFASFAFDASVLEIFGTLIKGGSVLLLPRAARVDLRMQAELLRRAGATHCIIVPSHYASLLAAGVRLPDEMRCLALGGEAVPSSLVEEHVRLHPHIRLFNEYGPTENAVCSTAVALRDADCIRIGRPIPNTAAFVLDRNGHPAPIGVPGELYLGGRGLARAYLGRPSLTAERFVPNPFSAKCGERLYRSGDRVRWRDDASIEFLGRMDGQVKLRGFRIELREIEAHLIRNPLVRQCAVLLRRQDSADAQLVAFVVPAAVDREQPHEIPPVNGSHSNGLSTLDVNGTDLKGHISAAAEPHQRSVRQSPTLSDPVKASKSFAPDVAIPIRGETDSGEVSVNLSQDKDSTILDLRRLREDLRSALPEYMLPSLFVELPALPLLPNGKIDRKALAAIDPYISSHKGEAPATATERGIAAMWAELLGQMPESRESDFFAMGGHSLMATRLCARLEEHFGTAVPVRQIFATPRLLDLADVIDRAAANAAEAPLTELIDRGAGDPPLSFAQQRLWFLDRMDKAAAVYNMPVALQLRGRLDAALLERALNEIVRRHEILRTSFPLVDDSPIQNISETSTVSLPPEDLSEVSCEDGRRRARELARMEADRAFDLEKEGPLRVRLLRLGPDEHVLLLTLHHIAADGWSMSILVEELRALYAAFAAAATSPLPDLSLQYADYTLWQRRRSKAGQSEAQLAYWLRQLADPPDLLRLPGSYPRPAVQSYRGASQPLTIPFDLAAALRRLAGREDATLFMLLHAAFVVLLARYSGERDIMVGTPIANRQLPGSESLIGLFLNTIVLRSRPAPDSIFRDLVRESKGNLLDAFANQDLPFEQLVDELQPTRSLSHSPLFQVMFVLQNAPEAELQLEGLELAPLDLERKVARFDLTLSLTEGPEAISGEIEYNSDLFSAEFACQMAEHLLRVLWQVVRHPAVKVEDIALLSPAEQERVIDEWSIGPVSTNMSLPEKDARLFSNIADLIRAQALRTPERTACSFEGQSLSYAGLLKRAGAIAHELRRRNVGPESIVGVLMRRSLELPPTLLGIMLAGGAYLPLGTDLPAERLTFMLDDARAVLLISDEADDGALAQLPIPLLRIADCPSDSQSPDRLDAPSAAVGLNAAYLIYTSGSTGKPKAVITSHEALINRLLWMQQYSPLDEDDTVLQKTPYNFDVSVWEFFWPLLVGARLVLARPEGHRDASYLTELIAKEEVSTIHFVPPMLRAFLDEPGLASCRSLRRVFCSGDVLPRATQDLFFESCDADLYNLYGPTEAAIDVSAWHCSRQASTAAVPIGRPIDNCQIFILDENMRPLPAGIDGELYIGGIALARAYSGRPGLSAKTFVPHPFSTTAGARLYRSGDLARFRPDGAIEFIGRRDHQIKLRGYRIELGEIEACLNDHPAIAQVAVIIRAAALWAYLVPHKDDSRIDLVASLRKFAQQFLPAYMMPEHWMQLDAMPLSSNGKVSRSALLKRNDSAAPGQRESAPPRTDKEKILAAVWRDVLQQDNIGIHDNFFALGGDSILSIRIVSQAQRHGLYFGLQELFQHQDVASLATIAKTESSTSAQQGTVSGSLPLTPIQHWFFEQEMSEAHHFNQSLLFQTPPDLDAQLLPDILRLLTEHHDALRLCFTREGEVWRQEHQSAFDEPPFTVYDHSSLPASERSAALSATPTEMQAGFDLARGPLLRAALFQYGDEQAGRLLFVAHHLVIDGVSWRILLEDFESLYRRLRAGEDGGLPPKTHSFRDWSLRLAEFAGSAQFLAQADMWRDAAKTGVTPLPRDWECDDEDCNTVEAAAEIIFTLDASATDALLREVPAAYNSRINDALLAALARALARWSGGAQILVDVEGHGREALFEDIDLSRTVGWFTSIFPLRLDLADDAGPGEDLVAVKERLRAMPLSGVGYGLLRYLSPDEEIRRHLREAPQAELLFNYHGRLEAGDEANALLRGAEETTGPMYSPRLRRRHLIEVNAVSSGGHLHLTWRYGSRIHRRSSIAALSQHFEEALRGIIEHCRAPGAGACTPSDFPEAELSYEALRALGPARTVEAIYPLSPSQQGMLFESLLNTSRALHVEQSAFRLKALRDPQRLRDAWQGVFERHDVLRTEFDWRSGREALQIVRRGLALPWRSIDLRTADTEAQEAQIQSLMADERQRAFALDQAPLMRLVLARLSEEEYHFIWTHHHILLDGWSVATIMDELQHFFGEESRHEPLPAPRPYRDYIRWLGQQNLDKAEAYWCQLLSELELPTPPGKIAERPPNVGEGFAALDTALDAAESAALLAFAQDQRISVNTILQAAWALLLSRYSEQSRVVFGATVAGRPPEMAGIETMTGLFISTLPVVTDCNDDRPLGEWLQELHRKQLAQREFEFCSSGQIHQWSGREARQALYDSILVFENYPAQGAVELEAGELLRVDAMQAQGAQTGYALNILAAQTTRLHLRLVHDRGRLGNEAVSRIAEHLRSLLRRIPQAATASPNEVRKKIGDAEIPDYWPASLPLETKRSYRAPRTSVEHRLAQIWTEIFDMPDIGVEDNFFVLGGHSLMAARLMDRIRQEFGLQLPLAALFENGSIAALARFLESTGIATKEWSPLVAIHTQGTRPPIFCVHPAGGNVLCYSDLAQALGPEQPLYGLQAFGLVRGQEAIQSVPAMAETYLAALLESFPTGPYQLAGWSFGGMVAYEMARQLEERGFEVGLLAMLDAYPRDPADPRDAPSMDDAAMLAAMVKDSLQMSADDIRAIPVADRIPTLVAKLQDSGSVPADFDQEQAERFFGVFKANSLNTYVPQGYKGRLCLFHGTDHKPYRTEELIERWRPICPAGGMDVEAVSGRHDDFVYPPNVAGLAEKIQQRAIGR